ncbi:MAG TPA: helix-turn-helix domain-containing protein [Treponemataceae bacterium]|nr:helix-turn-helix domain-containing protein [Treponemataceae bacterium]
MITYLGKEYACPMEMTLDLIGGKWKALILWHLAMDGTLRFGMLRKQFPKVTQKMLTQQLRELERDGLVLRKVYQEVPPKVEYSLTEMGASLLPMLQALNEWGQAFAKEGCPSRKPAISAVEGSTERSTARAAALV